MKKTIIVSSMVSLMLSAFIMTFSNKNDDLMFEQMEHIESVKDFEIQKLSEGIEIIEKELAELKAELDQQDK